MSLRHQLVDALVLWLEQHTDFSGWDPAVKGEVTMAFLSLVSEHVPPVEPARHGVFSDEQEWQRHLHELAEWRSKTGGEVVGGTLILEPAEFADPAQAQALMDAKIQNVTSSFAASARSIAQQRGWLPKSES